MATLLLLVALSCQEPPSDDIAASFPSPLPAERQWELAAAYSRRIAERIAAGDLESVPNWYRRGWERLPRNFGMSICNAGLGSWPESRRRAVGVGLRLAGREPFTEAQIWEAAAADANLATHLAWIRLCEEGIEAGCRDFESQQGKFGEYWEKRYQEMVAEWRKLGDTPEGLLAVARHAGTFGSGCPAAHFALLRRIRRRLDTEKQGPSRVILWEAGAMALIHLMDHDGAWAWKNRAIDEPNAGSRGADLLLEWSNELFNRGNFEAAAKGYQRLIEGWPRSPQVGSALFNLGMTLRKLRRYEDARSVLDRLIRSNVNDRDPGGSLMETDRNYRGRAVDEIAACWEEEGRWDLAMQVYETLGRQHPKVSWCGTCLESMGRARMIGIARAQAMSGRYQAALDTYLSGLHRGDAGPSQSMIVGAVSVAVRLGKLDTVISAFPERSRVLEEILTYLCALRFRANRDTEGLLKLLVERGRADKWGNLREVDEYRESQQELALDIIDLAGTLGSAIIGPLKQSGERDSSMKPWTYLMIAAVRSESAWTVIEEDRTEWRRRLVQIYQSPKRQRVFEPADLEKPEMKRAIDEAIRAAAARMGQSPPDDIQVMEMFSWTLPAAGALIVLVGLVIWVSKRWVARARSNG